MKRKNLTNLALTAILFALFGLFTLAVMHFDVKQIGPQSSSVGFASINGFILRLTGVNLIWYNITDWLGLAAITVAFAFAVTGLCQLIHRRSLFKVSSGIIVLGFIYILIIAAYIFFELNIVNYRPTIIYKSLEASYPSSHTMIVVSIMVTACMEMRELIKSRAVIRGFDILSAAIIAVTVIGRLISGVHWFSDIIGGLLLSAALIMLYYFLHELIKGKKSVGNKSH